MEQRAKGRIKPIIQNGSEGHNREPEAKEQDGSLFHVIVSSGSFYIGAVLLSEKNFSSLNVGF
jgi:hypothetical protein